MFDLGRNKTTFFVDKNGERNRLFFFLKQNNFFIRTIWSKFCFQLKQIQKAIKIIIQSTESSTINNYRRTFYWKLKRTRYPSAWRHTSPYEYYFKHKRCLRLPSNPPFDVRKLNKTWHFHLSTEWYWHYVDGWKTGWKSIVIHTTRKKHTRSHTNTQKYRTNKNLCRNR